MRIVSLLASATEMVDALGAGASLVGRSHECDYPSWVTSLPQCSEPAFNIHVSSREIDREVNRRVRAGEPLYIIDHDRIGELRPDVIIAQEHCEVCAVTPADVNRNGCAFPDAKIVVLSASSVKEIYASLRQIAQVMGAEKRAETIIDLHLAHLDEIRGQTAGLRRPTVAVLEWVDPIFTSGNWIPELVEIAGGEPVLATPGQHSRAADPQLLLDADPDFVVIAPCGYKLERSIAELEVLESFPWWHKLRAVREGKVAFADGNYYFNRSGLSITTTAEILAEILHGMEGDCSTEKKCWRWYTDCRVRVP